MSGLEAILLTVMTAATPLLIAALGELVVERSGVLNLGVEGMMIMGAVMAFAGLYYTDSMAVALLAAMFGGMLLSLLFGFLTLTLATNQVASGLSLTLLGLGLSGMIGEAFIGQPGRYLPSLDLPVLSDIPLIGPVLFGQNVLVYFSFVLLAGVSWFLFKTRAGLVLRAVGNNHHSAHALGYPVIRIRYLAVLFGGACSGLAGAYLPLAYTPQWTEGMTAGLRRACGRLSATRLHPAVDRGHDRRARLDRPGPCGLCKLAAAARRGRRLSVRGGADPSVPRPGRGGADRIPAAVGLALSRDHRRSGHHFAQPADDQQQHACLAGAGLRSGPLRRPLSSYAKQRRLRGEP